MRFRRTHGVLIGVTALALIVSACGAGKKSSSGGGGGSASGGGGGGPITVGTTDKVTAIDPAGSYDNGSLLVEIQIYQFLMSIPAKAQTPQPDAAQSCSFTKPTEYTCKMKSGLKFSNGDPVTAKDAAFSFQRQCQDQRPQRSGLPARQHGLGRAPDDSTVVFTLKAGNDQTWPYHARHGRRADRRQQGLPGRQTAAGRADRSAPARTRSPATARTSWSSSRRTRTMAVRTSPRRPRSR